MKTIDPERGNSNALTFVRSVDHGILKGAILVAAAMVQFFGCTETACANEDDVRLTGTFGADYSNGGYGTTRNTNVLLNLSSLNAQIGDFKLSASVPYMRISGRGLVVFDAAGNPILINRRTSIVPNVRSGFGDLNLSATYTLPPAILDDFQVELTARAKVPTASTRRRLSTGVADFGFNVDVSRQIDFWRPFITVGYLISGQPSNYSLYNTVSIAIGTTIELDKSLVAIISYDQDSASAPQVGASREILGSLSWILSDSTTLTGYGTAGLSSGSPSVGTGLIVSYTFN